MTVEVERATAPVEKVTITTSSRKIELSSDSGRMPFMVVSSKDGSGDTWETEVGVAIKRDDLIEFCKAALEMFGE